MCKKYAFGDRVLRDRPLSFYVDRFPFFGFVFFADWRTHRILKRLERSGCFFHQPTLLVFWAIQYTCCLCGLYVGFGEICACFRRGDARAEVNEEENEPSWAKADDNALHPSTTATFFVFIRASETFTDNCCTVHACCLATGT